MYIDPMGAPGQTNARNYGSDYYVVISPGPDAGLKMEQIRHTYLHYLLDPLAMKYPATMKRLEPLLETVKTAPMDQSFKSDVSLLVTECFIRAIEARTAGSRKAPEAEREQAVQNSAQQGFVLTRYFYEALVRFEKDPAGLSNAYGDLVSGIDLGKERKRAAQVSFASTSDTELLHLSRPHRASCWSRPSSGFLRAMRKARKNWRKQALDEKSEDQGRALFILAEVATHNSDMQGATELFRACAASGARTKGGGLVPYLSGKNFRPAGRPGGGDGSLPGGGNSGFRITRGQGGRRNGIAKTVRAHPPYAVEVRTAI